MLPVSSGSASRARPSTRLQPPPRRTGQAVFPHPALLPASGPGLCDLPQRQRFRRRQARLLHLTRPDQSSPERISPSQVLQITGAFLRAPLPSVLTKALRAAGPLRSTGITPPQHYCGPIRHPLIVGPLPGAAGYKAYPASAVSGRDEEGFSSCWVCPCRRAVANHPAGGMRRVNRSSPLPTAFAPPLRARPPGLHLFGASTRSLALRPGDSPPSQGWVVNRLQVSRFPSCLPFRLRGFRLLPRRD